MKNVKVYLFITILCSLYFYTLSFSQTKVSRVVFYNVENLFDTLDDPKKRDNDFLPQGRYRWNSYKYFNKIKNLGKVLVNIGASGAPDLIGLCEVENRKVVEDLKNKSPLRKWSYGISHFESKDPRGIDVALLYKKEAFQIHKEEKIIIRQEGRRAMRDVLYVKGSFKANKDTLHIFVNHWSSNYSGAFKANLKRQVTARKLKTVLDSIRNLNPQAKLLLMGDFNTSPSDAVLDEILGAKDFSEYSNSAPLYNLMHSVEKNGKGTYRLKKEFVENLTLDHFIVSQSLLQSESNTRVLDRRAHVFDKKWLYNKKGMPKRTHRGPKYEAGFSDHLPVYLDLFY